MKNSKRIEDLLINLPDYITGILSDASVIKAIEEELRVNPEFRDEYRNMSASLNYIKDIKIIEPDAYYFNNMIPLINEKIRLREKEHYRLHKLIPYLKYAVPVMTILIIIFIYRINYWNPAADSVQDVQQTITENTLKFEEQKNSNNDLNKVDTTAEINQNTEAVETLNNTENKKFISKNTKYINSRNNALENQETIENDFDEEIFNTDEPEEISAENEFLNLSSEQQNFLLTKLENTKF